MQLDMRATKQEKEAFDTMVKSGKEYLGKMALAQVKKFIMGQQEMARLKAAMKCGKMTTDSRIKE